MKYGALSSFLSFSTFSVCIHWVMMVSVQSISPMRFFNFSNVGNSGFHAVCSSFRICSAAVTPMAAMKSTPFGVARWGGMFS